MNGPLLRLWEFLLPLVKDMRIRFALAMLGNVFALWFLITYFKKLVPDIPDNFIS